MELKLNSPAHGQFIVLIDDEDYDLIKNYTWRISKNKNKLYASTNIYSSITKKGKHTFMHNMIMAHVGIDHKNGNGLDNRRCNLRIASQRQNAKNMSVSVLNKYGIKGVSYDKGKELYSVFITVDYKHIFVGYFNCVIEASNAYNKAAIQYHGEFSKLNEISPERAVELAAFKLPKVFKKRGKKELKSRGVSKCGNVFMSRITRNNITKVIGYFKTEAQAATAYNNASKQLK